MIKRNPSKDSDNTYMNKTIGILMIILNSFSIYEVISGASGMISVFLWVVFWIFYLFRAYKE
jgi:hypothetical protein